MIRAGALNLYGYRTAPIDYVIEFRGIDLSTATIAAQMRAMANAPGAPLVDLPGGVGAGVTGLRVLSTDVVDGVTVCRVGLFVTQTAIEALEAPVPSSERQMLQWDMQVTPSGGVKSVLLEGAVFVSGGVARSAASFGTPSTSGADAIVTVTDSSVTVTVQGTDLLAPLVTAAAASAAIAGTKRDEAEGFAEDAADAVVSVEQRISVITAPDRMLTVEGKPVLDGNGALIGARMPAWQPLLAGVTDRVLFDLLMTPGVQWRDGWRPGLYSFGDVVSCGSAGFFFCKADPLPGTTSIPVLDTSSWEPVPLVNAESYVFDDAFGGSGALAGRTVSGLTWTGTGSGFGNAVVGSGYLTSQGNTYMGMLDVPTTVPGTWSEFGNRWRGMVMDTAVTIGLSPDPLFFDDITPMWHTNYYTDRLVESKVFDPTIADPTYLYFWRAAGRLYPLVEHEIVWKIRGNWLFHYLDGAHVGTELAAKIGALVGFGNARSFYIQNHGADSGIAGGDTLGNERHERVWIKKAA